MPKSKNTRKKAYRPRQVKIGPYWPADQQADGEDKLTLNLGILFGNAKKGPWTPYSQDCRRSRHD